MASSLLEHLSHGTFNFLRPDSAEIRQIVPSAEDRLPEPQPIFLDDESASPLLGFPILMSPSLRMFEKVLEEYLEAEQDAQFAYWNREGFDSRTYSAKWERYSALLEKLTENVTSSSSGSKYSDIFWLYHSSCVARFLKEIPKRVRRVDLTIGREHGDEIKYRVFFKWIDRVVTLTYDTVNRLAAAGGDEEETLFPSVLSLMRDNVLIFTEDHVSPDLSELGSYFQGCLRTDGRDLRQRLAALDEWHEKNLESDAVLRSAVANLLGGDPEAGSKRLLIRPGYLTYLSTHATYSTTQFPTPEQVQVWESLLLKLKEFEVLQALRRMLVPIEVEDNSFVSRDRSVNTTWVGGPPVLRLSAATRPMDFMSSWVVDPLVRRYGLVYDISDFSAILSMLGRAEKSVLDNAFRRTFQLQTKVNKLAASLRLRLEKYLGDGAFYSGRQARHLLIGAIYVQRFYSEALEQEFPFDRGMRIAINYGEYRLLPLAGGPAERTAKYEYFGHGLVELSRLSTGKKTQEVEEFKNYLIGHGYPESTVNKFFLPISRQSSELVSKQEQARRFYAYINQNGTLINEGIVATESLVTRLGTFEELFFGRDEGKRGYVVIPLEEEAGSRILVGIRKLGLGKFKGLELMPIYEIVDCEGWPQEGFQEIPPKSLMSSLERLFATEITARSAKSRKRRATS
ncbi:MAG: hypothetical protein GY856_15780 [bacterium]|nr:hypothetical protein [bacterium]